MKTNEFKSERELLEDVLQELKALHVKLHHKKKNEGESDLLDNADAMQLLKITAKTAYRWRKDGVLKFVKINGKLYYRKKDIEELLKALQ